MDEKSRRISECLEDHLDVWRSDPEFMAKYKVIVDYIRNILKLDLEEDKILRVITSSYTNDFSHTLPNGNQVIAFSPEPPEPPETLDADTLKPLKSTPSSPRSRPPQTLEADPPPPL